MQTRLPGIRIRTELCFLPVLRDTLENHLHLVKTGIDLRVREVGGNELAHPAQASDSDCQARFLFHLAQQAFVKSLTGTLSSAWEHEPVAG